MFESAPVECGRHDMPAPKGLRTREIRVLGLTMPFSRKPIGRSHCVKLCLFGNYGCPLLLIPSPLTLFEESFSRFYLYLPVPQP